MYEGKLELHNIIKNLTKAKITAQQAEAIAGEIKNMSEVFHSNKVINIKLERILSIVDSKLYKLKAEILKWLIGISMIQILFNFALNCWGLN